MLPPVSRRADTATAYTRIELLKLILAGLALSAALTAAWASVVFVIIRYLSWAASIGGLRSQVNSEFPRPLIGTVVEQVIDPNTNHLDAAIVGGEYVAGDSGETNRNRE